MTFVSKIPAKLAMLLLALALAMSATTHSVGAREETSGRVGTSWVIELEGNPSTGYRWRLNQKESENPSIVKVEDLGYGEAKSKLIGAPAPYHFRLTGLSPGLAKLRFEYVRPWEGKPEKTKDVWVRVKN
jgi:predicted secreted protein